MGKADQIQLLAKMENVLDIPENQRLTHWFGDYSMWAANPGISMLQINKRIEELDALIEHSNSVKVHIQETRSRIIEVENARNMKDAIEVIKDLYDKQDLVMNEDDIEKVEVMGMEVLEQSNKIAFSQDAQDYSQQIEEVLEQQEAEDMEL